MFFLPNFTGELLLICKEEQGTSLVFIAKVFPELGGIWFWKLIKWLAWESPWTTTFILRFNHCLEIDLNCSKFNITIWLLHLSFCSNALKVSCRHATYHLKQTIAQFRIQFKNKVPRTWCYPWAVWLIRRHLSLFPIDLDFLKHLPIAETVLRHFQLKLL